MAWVAQCVPERTQQLRGNREPACAGPARGSEQGAQLQLLRLRRWACMCVLEAQGGCERIPANTWSHSWRKPMESALSAIRGQPSKTMAAS